MRTAYRKLAEKYPVVWLIADIELPTYNQYIKTLAQHLGFKWRDKDPSGAALIEWCNRLLKPMVLLLNSASLIIMRMIVWQQVLWSMLLGQCNYFIAATDYSLKFGHGTK